MQTGSSLFQISSMHVLNLCAVFYLQVIPGSPAERAGVRPGDVIVEFDGRSISTPYQVYRSLSLVLVQVCYLVVF
jgi:C-terminal processing protease CtpA/Prc